ncbi:MAG: acetolactate synthase small subunit [Ruminococcaceae bacterium]|nr:acetolactate synthase small subunit [Oscillospiraceae bacterium]
MQQGILSILVSNHFGVLTKVTGLFGRRGYNIKALSVGETENPEVSRITVLTEGDPAQLEQIYKQVCKLEEVRAAAILPEEQLIERELLLVKVCPGEKETGALMELVTNSAAKAVAVPDGGVIIEASGRPEQINELVERIRLFGVVELSRTGVTALQATGKALVDNAFQIGYSKFR